MPRRICWTADGGRASLKYLRLRCKLRKRKKEKKKEEKNSKCSAHQSHRCNCIRPGCQMRGRGVLSMGCSMARRAGKARRREGEGTVLRREITHANVIWQLLISANAPLTLAADLQLVVRCKHKRTVGQGSENSSRN